jgi:DNA processing protein
MNRQDSVCRDAIELTLIPGIGINTQNLIWHAVDQEPTALFTMKIAELRALGASADACGALRSRRFQAMAQEILDWGNREGCRFLVRGQDCYPEMLASMHDPPLVLYARGRVEALRQPAIAIVGTRRPTYYGLQMGQGLAADLASRGLAIVSGLARGIDAAAHQGCLENGGHTIAVLGCGIDVIYPREHRHLTQRILESGLLLSEFPPGTSPAPQNFPIRNRIISGLALGTLIVEASEYSGSLITARLAMEQGRELFALPGNLTSPQSFGPNYLIKQGAKLVQSWRDVVEELTPDLRREILTRETAQPVEAPNLDLLSDEEKRVLELLQTDQATQFDHLLKKSGYQISRLSSVLLDLEMGHWLRQVPGSLYVKIARPPK